ncbi:MAG: hypothetical protein JNL90_21080 [Planctomycetes bacterium]|nr:hypothetical protein [Planctomycetota bacterium]
MAKRSIGWGVALLAALGAGSGCTVVKPVVCTFTTPWQFVEAAVDSRELDDEDAVDDEAERLPTTCLCLAAPIVLPIRIVERMVTGCIGGLCTGLVSDLNVLVGNSERPTKNLAEAWRTNATTPSEAE